MRNQKFACSLLFDEVSLDLWPKSLVVSLSILISLITINWRLPHSNNFSEKNFNVEFKRF